MLSTVDFRFHDADPSLPQRSSTPSSIHRHAHLHRSPHAQPALRPPMYAAPPGHTHSTALPTPPHAPHNPGTAYQTKSHEPTDPEVGEANAKGKAKVHTYSRPTTHHNIQ
ncbi:uncharacterized protein K452DRAFT_291983 [Aplosporella prunicola CBS 121167]|uniref:Uncharacterized protein n=1 Tax=Aplosporella prunicola CBS 121167 TaxID=1176127 RepID=A0A6A6AYU7_9PEZI|nr:uncharacterized protein K452DRAFT_291983 [Aplosporella prunicola CBS 121167]KAF2136950.1 hypothetical protein K452DRAFT_291983 [Aplosporella prunicola CBS 121167]